jgi:hypothetical protein
VQSRANPSSNSPAEHLDRRVDISNDEEETLFDDNCDDRYTTWQLLLASEQAVAGVRIRMDFDGDGVLEGVGRTLENGRLPERRGYRVNFEPVYASREFRKHEKTLDAVVWFVEERWRVLSSPVRGQGGRFRLTTEQGTRYAEATSELAAAACRRFGVGLDDLVELIRCFAKRWSDWTREGRPLIANAYKEFLEGTVLLETVGTRRRWPCSQRPLCAARSGHPLRRRFRVPAACGQRSMHRQTHATFASDLVPSVAASQASRVRDI